MISDAQLVAGVLAGDRDSFAQVYDRYADRLRWRPLEWWSSGAAELVVLTTT